jgi:CRISPR/Cas system-associated endoribonuclease Cas2
MGYMAINKGEATKNILKFLLTAGLVAVAATNPRFGSLLLKSAMREYNRKKRIKENSSEKFYSAFAYMRKEGLIDVEYKSRQMYFSLTDEGKKRAGRYKINDLKIKKDKKWNGRWYVLIFDIEDKQKIKREALRGKIKELGLYQLQKSVWVCPYDFGKQIKLLRDFFGLTDKEMKIIIANHIENDKVVRSYFGI